MSDLHHLPLVGHDLPEYAPSGPPRKPRVRARVFKEGAFWTWRHCCGFFREARGYPHVTHQIALEEALDHLERCT